MIENNVINAQFIKSWHCHICLTLFWRQEQMPLCMPSSNPFLSSRESQSRIWCSSSTLMFLLMDTYTKPMYYIVLHFQLLQKCTYHLATCSFHLFIHIDIYIQLQSIFNCSVALQLLSHKLFILLLMGINFFFFFVNIKPCCKYQSNIRLLERIQQIFSGVYGTVGSKGVFTFIFTRYRQIQNRCINLHLHQQCMSSHFFTYLPTSEIATLKICVTSLRKYKLKAPLKYYCGTI